MIKIVEPQEGRRREISPQLPYKMTNLAVTILDILPFWMTINI